MKRCYVRFTPESRHSRLRQECPLRANSGHRRCQFAPTTRLRLGGRGFASVFAVPVARSPESGCGSRTIVRQT